MNALDGITVLEFGSGAAGPLATRYFADHGATVIRVESRARPDFLRLYGITATQPSLDASPMFAAFNCNKLAVTLNLKHREGVALAIRLVDRADVVAENFAPGAMDRLGLGYEALAAHKPGLVMVSTCLHGQTGPERDYPGFGGQGSALSGFNHLTGWPDREPLGPHGTITDSLSPRFAAVAVLAALWRRDRTGLGCHLDLSQVEAAEYCLSEMLVEHQATGAPPGRRGSRSARTAPHGIYPCAGDDRWIAIAVWSDDQWRALAVEAGIDDRRLDGVAGRLEHVEELDAALGAWTRARDRNGLAQALRARGIEATPVADMEDLISDTQLHHRTHLHPMEHPVIGVQPYESLGIRLADSPPSFTGSGPTLGRDNEDVFCGILGLTPEEYRRLDAHGAFS